MKEINAINEKLIKPISPPKKHLISNDNNDKHIAKTNIAMKYTHNRSSMIHIIAIEASSGPL